MPVKTRLPVVRRSTTKRNSVCIWPATDAGSYTVCARDGRSLKDMDADEFETIEFTVKMGDLDLASYDHPLVCQSYYT